MQQQKPMMLQPQGGMQMNQMGAPNMPPVPPGMGILRL